MRRIFYLILHDCGSPVPRKCVVQGPPEGGLIRVAVDPPFPAQPAYSPDRPISELFLGSADTVQALEAVDKGFSVVDAFVPRPPGHPSKFPMWRISTGTLHADWESALKQAPFEAFLRLRSEPESHDLITEEAFLLDTIRTSDGRSYLSILLLKPLPDGSGLGGGKSKLLLTLDDPADDLKKSAQRPVSVTAYAEASRWELDRGTPPVIGKGTLQASLR